MNKQERINELKDQGFTLQEAILELQAEEIEENIKILEEEEALKAISEQNCEVM